MLADLRTALLARSEIVDLVDQRIDPFARAEPGSAELPAIFYTAEDEEIVLAMQPQSLRSSVVSYVCISHSLATSDQVADEITTALDGQTISNTSSVRLVNRERDTIEPFDGGQQYFYTTTTTFQVWHT